MIVEEEMFAFLCDCFDNVHACNELHVKIFKHIALKHTNGGVFVCNDVLVIDITKFVS
jgi:hypothetical protein